MAKLAEWMKVATKEERERVAEEAGTSVDYLYQLAGGHRENPKLRLAAGIVRAIYTLHMETMGRLPVVDLADME